MSWSRVSSFPICLFVVAILGGCAASSDPCDKLLKRVCAAGGDTLCEQVREQHALRAEDPEATRKCASLLEDPTRLQQVLDGLRAAALLEVSLSGDAAAEKPAAGEAATKEVPKAPSVPAVKPKAKPAAPTAKPAASASPDGS